VVDHGPYDARHDVGSEAGRPVDPEPDGLRGISMGGAFMSEDLIRQAREVLGLEVLRVYAMAECMMAGQMRLTDPIDTRNVFDGFSRSDCPKRSCPSA
jgi:non-ribosomal peptide synthetase component E (peptide arylation enzyme)